MTPGSDGGEQLVQLLARVLDDLRCRLDLRRTTSTTWVRWRGAMASTRCMYRGSRNGGAASNAPAVSTSQKPHGCGSARGTRARFGGVERRGSEHTDGPQSPATRRNTPASPSLCAQSVASAGWVHVPKPSRHQSLPLGTEQNRRSTTQTLPTERKRHGLRPRITQRHDRNALTPAEPHPNHIDATASRGEPHGRATRRDRSSRDRHRLRQVVRVVPLAAHAVAVACSNHRRCSRARCAAGLRLECRGLANERVTCSQCASCGAAVPDDRRLAVCRGACASATSGRKPSPESVRSHGRRTTVRPRALWHARRDRGCNTRFALSSEPPYAPRRRDSRRHCPKEIADE